MVPNKMNARTRCHPKALWKGTPFRYLQSLSNILHTSVRIIKFESLYLSIEASKTDLLKHFDWPCFSSTRLYLPESSNRWFSRKRRRMACCWGWTWIFHVLFFCWGGGVDLSYSRLDVDNMLIQGRKQEYFGRIDPTFQLWKHHASKISCMSCCWNLVFFSRPRLPRELLSLTSNVVVCILFQTWSSHSDLFDSETATDPAARWGEVKMLSVSCQCEKNLGQDRVGLVVPPTQRSLETSEAGHTWVYFAGYPNVTTDDWVNLDRYLDQMRDK